MLQCFFVDRISCDYSMSDNSVTNPLAVSHVTD